MPTSHLLKLTIAFGIAVITSGCVTDGTKQSEQRALEKAKANTLLSILILRHRQSLDDGPSYTLTELRGLANAFRFGVEGENAATLWRQEIVRHHREALSATLRHLRIEVAHMGTKRISGYLGQMLPDDASAKSVDAESVGPTTIIWRSTDSVRQAQRDALCRSLRSTPSRWARLYPERQPFSFERFGIDYTLMKRWCARQS